MTVPSVFSVTAPAPSSVIDAVYYASGNPAVNYVFMGAPGAPNLGAMWTVGTNEPTWGPVQAIAEFQISSYSPSMQDYIAFHPTSILEGSAVPSGDTVNVYFSSGTGVYSPSEFSTPGNITTSFTIPDVSTWYGTLNWEQGWAFVPVPSSLVETLAQSDGFLRVQIGDPTVAVVFSYAELITLPDNVAPESILSSHGPLGAGETLPITVNLTEL